VVELAKPRGSMGLTWVTGRYALAHDAEGVPERLRLGEIGESSLSDLLNLFVEPMCLHRRLIPNTISGRLPTLFNDCDFGYLAFCRSNRS
jgi:hypothetical protein